MNQWIYKFNIIVVFGVIICAVANILDKEDNMIITILLSLISYRIWYNQHYFFIKLLIKNLNNLRIYIY
jgi:hypothetical protein